MAFERCMMKGSPLRTMVCPNACKVLSIYHDTPNSIAQKYVFIEYGKGTTCIEINKIKYSSFPAAAKREIVEAFKQEKIEKIVFLVHGMKRTEYYIAGEFDKINNRRNELNRIKDEDIISREIL